MNHSGSAESPAPTPRILSIERGVSDHQEPLEAHAHPEPLLLSVSSATVIVTTPKREWLIPPGYGLWIPAGIEHGGTILRAGEGSAVTVDPDRCPIAWAEPTGVLITPLLRELMSHLHHSAATDPSRPRAEALLFDLLVPQPAHAIHVAIPTDPRARTIAELLIANPSDQRQLDAWADHVHASVRTLARLFVGETGLSFARWRTQVRIRAAVGMLADGDGVAQVARSVGYRKTSAFIAAFRRATGSTPGAYVHAGAPTLEA